jgi:hypothetical protein
LHREIQADVVEDARGGDLANRGCGERGIGVMVIRLTIVNQSFQNRQAPEFGRCDYPDDFHPNFGVSPIGIPGKLSEVSIIETG